MLSFPLSVTARLMTDCVTIGNNIDMRLTPIESLAQPLSEHARLILALIRKYPMIEGKYISIELGIDSKQILECASELYQKGLIGVQFSKSQRHDVLLSITKYYPN